MHGNDERGTRNDELQRTQNGKYPDVSGTPPDVSGQNANDVWTQKERVRAKHDILTVI